MTNTAQVEGGRGGRARLVAALCSLIAFGWVAYLATRFPVALGHGASSIAGLLVFGCLLTLTGIDFVRHIVGRRPLGTTRDVWFQWMAVNAIWIGVMNWDTRRGKAGICVGAGSILLGVLGRVLERRTSAAEPRVAADRAAPGR
jgi:hypothetical protein